MPQVQTRPSQARSVAAPRRLPLIVTADNRDETTLKDAKLVNGYAEKDPLTGEWQVYKRFGYGGQVYETPPGTGRGMFQWVGNVTVSYVDYSVPVAGYYATLTAGASGSVVGYDSDVGSPYGSITLASQGGLPIANTISVLQQIGASNLWLLAIKGFSADPTATFVESITIGLTTYDTSTATYSYTSGEATWQWTGLPGFVDTHSYSFYLSFPDAIVSVPQYTEDPLLAIVVGAELVLVTQGSTPSYTNLTLPTTGGVCRFCQIPASTPLLMFSDGVTGAFFTDGTTVTKVTDVNYPGSPVPGIVILDATIYVMDVEGRIWGSTNPDDPTTWSALNVIRAQVEGDLGVYLAKQLSYVIALKQWTTEFFYDAGQPPPGSPLAPVQGAMLNYGCLSAQTVQDIDNLLIWVTSDKAGTPQVAILQDLSMQFVSNPAVERLLKTATANTPFVSHILHLAGHRMYVVSRLDTNVTMVYDIDQKIWPQWTSSSGGAWPMMASSYDIYGNALVQELSTGIVRAIDVCSVFPTDNGAVAPVDIFAPNFDAGIDRRKQLNFLRIEADQQSGSTLLCQYSDDDYQTWSQYREIDLSEVRPTLDREGTFYRRAYHFRHAAPTALRIRSVDLQLDIGTL